jgi:hypothetical protein
MSRLFLTEGLFCEPCKPYLQHKSVPSQVLYNFLLQHSTFFICVSELEDLTGEDQAQADQPNSLWLEVSPCNSKSNIQTF